MANTIRTKIGSGKTYLRQRSTGKTRNFVRLRTSRRVRIRRA